MCTSGARSREVPRRGVGRRVAAGGVGSDPPRRTHPASTNVLANVVLGLVITVVVQTVLAGGLWFLRARSHRD